MTRQQSTSQLEKQLKSKDVFDLILHGDQKEFVLCLSKHQKFQVEKEGRHVLKELQVFSRRCDEMKSELWRKAYEIASDELVTDVCRHTIERWCVLYKDDYNKLSVSDRGKHAITKDLNPFLRTDDNGTEKIDDDDVRGELRSWALEHLEELTI